MTVIQPGTHILGLMHIKRSGLTIVEPVPLGSSLLCMTVTRGAADGKPGQLFHILLTNLSWNPGRVPNHMVAANAMDTLKTIATTGISQIACKANNSSDMPEETKTMNETSSLLGHKNLSLLYSARASARWLQRPGPVEKGSPRWSHSQRTVGNIPPTEQSKTATVAACNRWVNVQLHNLCPWNTTPYE